MLAPSSRALARRSRQNGGPAVPFVPVRLDLELGLQGGAHAVQHAVIDAADEGLGDG